MFRRKEKKIKLTRAEKKELNRQDFVENLPRRLTVKFAVLIWFIGCGFMLKYFGNRLTLSIMSLFFIVSLLLGYLLAAFLAGKYRDKVLWFYGIKDNNVKDEKLN
ncbi:MAG: hypothetical protein ACYCSB_04100 [bacterium]